MELHIGSNYDNPFDESPKLNLIELTRKKGVQIYNGIDFSSDYLFGANTPRRHARHHTAISRCILGSSAIFPIQINCFTTNLYI